MSPETIIKQAIIDGVNLTITPKGTIKAAGNKDVVTQWLPVIKKYKPAIIKELQAESRQQKVLNMLIEKSDSERAYVTDTTNDPGNVIITIAIRDLATFEMLIPRSKYDPFLLMELISEGVVQ